MPHATLSDTSYGKSGIRLVKVTRRGDRHELCDFTVAVRFEGDYDASYADGDNADVLPTDTMKNTVYALAAGHPIREPEAFGLLLGRHFITRNPRLRRVTVDITAHEWQHLAAGEREHGQAFARRGPDTRTAQAVTDRNGARATAGIADLFVLKSSRSGFAGFPRDEYTTLAETNDRLLATSLTATWTYGDADPDYGPAWRAVRLALLDAFAAHDSRSVQHTLYAMGQAVLDTVDAVETIRLVMPNRHHLPVDLSPFGIEPRNEIFVAVEEPYGLISATLHRQTGA